MAAAQKKNTKSAKAASRKKQPAVKPIHSTARLVGGLVCLFLALCVVVSYFGVEAALLTLLAQLLKGLVGYGYWLMGLMLVIAGVNLIWHKECPVVLRTVCALLVPVLLGSFLHLLLCGREYEIGTAMVGALWADGKTLACGGVVSGGLAVLGTVALSGVVTGILLVILLLACVFIIARTTPRRVVAKVRESRSYDSYDEDEESLLPDDARMPTPTMPKRTRRTAIDIPLDDAPVTQPLIKPEELSEEEAAALKPEKKPLFARKNEDVKTPAEVLCPKTEADEAAAEKPLHSKSVTLTEQEVQSAAEEVSREIEEELAEPEEAYHYPPITLLEENRTNNYTEVGAELRNNSRRLAETLHSFGVDAKPGEVVHGPSVTRYEFTLDQGVKLSKITNLADDIALALGASGVRIAPVPDKISVVGIEVPNRAVTAVRIRDVIESRTFTEHRSQVAFSVGKDIGGNCIVGDIAKLPHVLIAGTTGSGKSVCTNSLIISMLYKSTPDEVRFIMVDPKMVELAPYNGIPHLLIPVVTDPKKAAGALQWAVFEMMKRYKAFSEKGVKDLAGYNALSEADEEIKKLPTVVVVIDELADLMLVAAKEVEDSICRVAQMGRAAGMHLVIATQRPSADVITGLMKANIPSRIAFAVASSLESRIILDTPGAEKLVGKGDMLYFPLGNGKPTRVQGCFITPEEIERVVKFVKESGETDYSDDVMQKIEEVMRKDDKGSGKQAPSNDVKDDGDELLPAAVEVILETGQASVSMLQRRLKLGYSRAARLVDQMEERGIVGPFEGSKPRQVLIDRAKWQEMQMANAEPEPTFDRNGSISDLFDSHDALD
ncbi:MAG: DNA translocase FtsK [Eubacteriales bacterium]|nr:DNA translocase FtsK [Eubacteriales bacterium]